MGCYKKPKKWWTLSMKSPDLNESLKIRGSIYEAVCLGGLACGATRDSCFQQMLEFPIPKNDRMICFPKMSKIHFPGLGTLRLATCTTDFRMFSIFYFLIWGTFFPIFWDGPPHSYLLRRVLCVALIWPLSPLSWDCTCRCRATSQRFHSRSLSYFCLSTYWLRQRPLN